MTIDTSPTPDAAGILEVATGYMAAKQLFESSRIGLFTALVGGSLRADGIAAATGVSTRMARILADAMTAKDLLTRADGRYALTDAASAYLVGETSVLDLGPFLTFLSDISYPHWLQFGRTVDTTEPGDLQMDDGRWATFMAGVMTYNRLHGQEFGRLVDLAGVTHALDFGGLSAAFAIAAMQANPDLSVTFLYAPGFEDGLEAAVAEAGLTDRARVLLGDTATVEPEGRYDGVFAHHVIHRFSADENRTILRRLHAVAEPGAVLTLLDFFLDDDAEQRAIDALHAGEYLVIDGTVVYPETEVREWLAEAGWRVRDRIALPGSPRVLIATAA